MKAICERHGVPYIEEHVLRRFAKTVAILVGEGEMKRAGALAETPARAA